MSFIPFILASIVARAMRFYLVAALLYWFGEPIRDFIEKRLSLVTTAFVVAAGRRLCRHHAIVF